MNKLLIILSLVALLLVQCKSYVQVFETKSTNTKTERGSYVFENDTLKIKYNFWSKKGLMTFSVYNKLDIPIYIDWKKASFIDNSVKQNYWTDKEITNSTENAISYYYYGSIMIPFETSRIITSSSVKVERITFTPPKSKYTRSQFYILPVEYFKMDKSAIQKEVPRINKPKKTTKIYEISFSKENSPLVFRNFVTFSCTEDFETEFYVDNEFYISKVIKMKKKQFEQYVSNRDKMGRFFPKDKVILMIRPHKKGSSFYIFKDQKEYY